MTKRHSKAEEKRFTDDAEKWLVLKVILVHPSVALTNTALLNWFADRFVLDYSSVNFASGVALTHGAVIDRFICIIKLADEIFALRAWNIGVYVCRTDGCFSCNSIETSIRMWHRNIPFLRHKMLLICFRVEAKIVEHDGSVSAIMNCFDLCQDIIRQVVVMNL